MEEDVLLEKVNEEVIEAKYLRVENSAWFSESFILDFDLLVEEHNCPEVIGIEIEQFKYL